MGRGELWLLSVNFLRPLSSNKVKTMKIKQEFAPGSAPKALVALFLTLKNCLLKKFSPALLPEDRALHNLVGVFCSPAAHGPFLQIVFVKKKQPTPFRTNDNRVRGDAASFCRARDFLAEHTYPLLRKADISRNATPLGGLGELYRHREQPVPFGTPIRAPGRAEQGVAGADRVLPLACLLLRKARKSKRLARPVTALALS